MHLTSGSTKPAKTERRINVERIAVMDTAKAKEAAERIVRLMTYPDPQSLTWRPYLITARLETEGRAA